MIPLILQILFAAVLGIGLFIFYKKIVSIRRNIFLGHKENRSDKPGLRLKKMARVALGQGKMGRKPIAAFLHIIVYVGFVLINIELVEIIIDGITGSHRIFWKPLGGLYTFAIGFFEILAVLVIVACVIFLIRRNILKIARFQSIEMKKWPKMDANIILYIEITLMLALLIMNAADFHFQEHTQMPISGFMANWMSGFSHETLNIIEKSAWWFHIVGILIFLNYVPYSKHFHIILAFPNTYYSNLKPKGEFDNLSAITTEIKLMMDPSATPPAGYTPPESFGANDVKDLSWKNLLDAYTCTECGRCTSVCPANITGKLLSPRKIMMDVRDRIEEVGKGIDEKGESYTDDKDLHQLISQEELWACTSCNACTDICPIEIDPLNIIVKMRQNSVMAKSEAPAELNMMFTNIENNGAPWQFPPSDRDKWSNEIK